MKNTLGVLINPKNQRILQSLVLVAVFGLSFLIFAAFYLSHAYLSIQAYTRQSLTNLGGPTQAALHAFDTLESIPAGQGCTVDTLSRLSDAAFLPDGINEFMFMSGDQVLCTSSGGLFSMAVPLGPPRLAGHGATPLRLWFDVDLGLFGHNGQQGIVLQRGRFAVILPKVGAAEGKPGWLALESVLSDGKSALYHLHGTPGLFDRNAARPAQGLLRISDAWTYNSCAPDIFSCVAVAVPVYGFLLHSAGWLALAVAFCALFASFAAERIRAFLLTHFAFEARLGRNLDYRSIVCTYQAILDASTRQITGCEVLTRWRDIDGSLVFPDQFIPVLERQGRMMEFTRLVARKAWDELEQEIPADRPLQVNFNVSPQDFTDPGLPALFEMFLGVPERFSVAVEIVESNRIDFDQAERIITTLRDKGILTYIDDFGSGYSNMENLARLSVDAVKLDKSFGMAPPHSLMAEMMDFAIQMAHTIGRVIVVEGVETAERLEHLLKGMVPVQYLQGYHIARPVDIRSFAALLRQCPAEGADTKAAASHAEHKRTA